MSARAVTLRLPAPLYDRFQTRAERAHRTVEAEILEAVAMAAVEKEEIPDDAAEAVRELGLLSDDELWRAGRNRLSKEVRSQLETLNLKQQKGQLAPAERETLEQLVHQYDLAVLVRAEAARLLRERGHDASQLLTAR